MKKVLLGQTVEVRVLSPYEKTPSGYVENRFRGRVAEVHWPVIHLTNVTRPGGIGSESRWQHAKDCGFNLTAATIPWYEVIE